MTKVKSKSGLTFESEKCARCTGKCCRYALIDLPAPRSRLDFDNYAWYLAHEHMKIYYDAGKWYLAVNTKCRYLDNDNRCMAYDKRFEACRDHTDENCEFDSDYVADKVFADPFELKKFGERRFRKMGKRKSSAPKRKK